MWMIVAPIPLPSRTITETNATLEKRGTATLRPAARVDGSRLRHRTSSPISPPIQTDARGDVEPVEEQRQRTRRSLRRMAGDAGNQHDGAAAARNAPTIAPSAAIERCASRGRSTQIAIHAAAENSAKQSSRST